MTQHDALSTVLQYHQQTKHDFQRYARGPGQLDWANQPDPFRRYLGAELYRLPLHTDRSDANYISEANYADLYQANSAPAQALSLDSLAYLLRNSLALSAWKEAGGSRWALRVNPSSGNLHPTEGYVLCEGVDGLAPEPSVYHYAPAEHGLEQRCVIGAERWQALRQDFPESTLFIGLSSLPWREAWKYGARAYRYCQLDLGHAIAALSLAAAALGWHSQVVSELGHAQVRQLLGLPKDSSSDPEAEQADCLIAISPTSARGGQIDSSLIAQFETLNWCGQASRLSPEYRAWPEIDAVTRACDKPVTAVTRVVPVTIDAPLPSAITQAPIRASTLFQQRRSAVAMDGHSSLDLADFYPLLQRLMPNPLAAPFNTLTESPQVHLLLFVHRVRGLAPGLYLLVRDPAQVATLKAALSSEFTWTKPPGCANDLPFYALLEGDARQAAQQIACQQEIAADGVFSLGMLANFREPLQQRGAWLYPQLFWECGMLGQVLYLEAENVQLRGTGIGCFFDEPFHRLIGLTDNRYQCLYHFTVGGAVTDNRLITLAPYPIQATDNDK